MVGTHSGRVRVAFRARWSDHSIAWPTLSNAEARGSWYE
jgi:hypothetical protein